MDLTWTPPASDGGSPIIGYQIERSIDRGTNWTVIAANTGSTATTYSSTGLSPLTTYTYRVTAINSVGMSNPSDTASAQTFTLCVGICL
ncbi:MAG: fibronectin type III domain-containing protein [Thaumarchaeota archaeon]|nr:MAG: fibronectin type III domain-containing protein [Nitrososphaerota archaeon]